MEIGDVTLAIMRAKNHLSGENFKELIIGYKTIYYNTYTIHVHDLSGDDESSRKTLRRHVSQHIWEQPVYGQLLNYNQLFATCTVNGLYLSYLGSKPTVRLLDYEDHIITIHSLDKYSYLKLDPGNMITYAFEDDDNRVIEVQNEWSTKAYVMQSQNSNSDTLTASNTDVWAECETFFETVYCLRVTTPSLQQLIILKSFYECSKGSDILKLIK